MIEKYMYISLLSVRTGRKRENEGRGGTRGLTLTHSHSHTVTQSCTHTLMHSCTHTLTHSHTRTLTHSHTQTLTHSHTLSSTHTCICSRETYVREEGGYIPGGLLPGPLDGL